MEEAQIKQIIERQPLHGSALLDPRCKILLLVCIGFVSYFLAGEVVSLALMLVYGLFIALGNGGKWAVKMIVTYIILYPFRVFSLIGIPTSYNPVLPPIPPAPLVSVQLSPSSA